MKIIEVVPQGYCGGVMNAIKKVKQLRDENPEAQITVLGNLVHNEFVKQALAKRNIHTIEDPGRTRLELLDDVNDGIVVFTAHGVSQAVIDKAKEKGLEILDASCPFVLSTQKIVAQKLDEGKAIFYIGKNHHPEAESIYSSSDQVYLIEKEDDIPDHIEKPVFVTNQTTMSIFDLQHLFEAIRKKYPDAQFQNELCNATRIRQQAILDLEGQGIDVLIVVGDPTSNNTRKLESIGQKAGIKKIYRVESALDVKNLDIGPDDTVAITSGASTPGSLKDGVVKALKNPKEIPLIDISKIL